MRFRAISSLALSIAVCNIVLASILSGCSGGHSSPAPTNPTPTPTPTPTPAIPTKVQTTIVWGQRSRQASTASSVSIAGLSSASSALITITGAQSGGGNVVYTANRPSTLGAAGGPQTYTSTSSAVPGTYLLSVQFYNLPLTSAGTVAPTAVVVGTAQASALIKPDGTISATIATAGKIRSVKILAGQQIPLGSATDIQYTAYGDPTSTGTPVIIPVSAGVALVSVTNQKASSIAVASAANGSVDGLYPGKAIVTLTVDNVSSDPADPASVVTVISNSTVAVTPNVASVLVSGQQTFTAAVAPASVDQTVVWSLAAGSPAGATIDAATGIFTAPNRSGDTYTVTATSVYDPTKSSTAKITVASNVVLKPTGGSLTINIGANKTVSLPVTVTGTSVTGITYTEVPGSVQGTLNSSNNYVAPSALGTDTVVVTSQADTAKTLTFNIVVGPSVTIAPHSSTISVGQTVGYTATVVGGKTGTVTYTASGGTLVAGTVKNTATYTPPAGSGTYTVTATSVDDPTQFDTATVTVQSGSGVITVD